MRSVLDHRLGDEVRSSKRSYAESRSAPSAARQRQADLPRCRLGGVGDHRENGGVGWWSHERFPGPALSGTAPRTGSIAATGGMRGERGVFPGEGAANQKTSVRRVNVAESSGATIRKKNAVLAMAEERRRRTMTRLHLLPPHHVDLGFAPFTVAWKVGA